MEINMQGGAKLPPTLPSARSADFPVKRLPQENTGASRTPDTEPSDAVQLDTKRLEQLQQAANNFFKDVFAVSDTTFSIFKDSSGQYITRFTSLRDGKVTYIPEPQMLQYMERMKQARQALVEIQA